MKRARHLIRAVKILARDGRIPRSLRGLAAFGVLPIPGPIDEAALLIVGALLWLFYRQPLRDAWAQAAAQRERTMPAMYLAGLPIPGPDVLELARLVNDSRLAERLETAYGDGARILALGIQERESILRALDDPPTRAFGELRATLLQEHVARVRVR